MMSIIAMLFGRLGGSFIGRMIAVGLVSLTALFGWSKYQQYVGGERREAKIVKNTKIAGKKKNVKSSKIRRHINPSTAAKRLWNSYGSN
jgi:hypothetical protein